jgi:hypothetical protein
MRTARYTILGWLVWKTASAESHRGWLSGSAPVDHVEHRPQAAGLELGDLSGRFAAIGGASVGRP